MPYFEPSTDGTEHSYLPPPHTHTCQWNFLKCKCHLNIRRKHRPWAYILGFIELPYFGSEQFSADIFGWTYLCLNRCIFICICIWIKLEQNICICICIWKIQIFVFVFDKTYLTPALCHVHTMAFIRRSCEIALRWMPQNTFDDKSTSVHIMAWYYLAIAHMLSQCWPGSVSSYGVIGPQRVKLHFILNWPHGPFTISYLLTFNP